MNATKIILDPSAPRSDVNEIRTLSHNETSLLFDDAALLCSSIEDNAKEAWFLTQGGQFIRATEKNTYLCDGAYARQMLKDFVVDPVFQFLDDAGLFSNEVVSARQEFVLVSDIIIDNFTDGTEYLEVSFGSDALFAEAKKTCLFDAELSGNTGLIKAEPLDPYILAKFVKMIEDGKDVKISGSTITSADMWPEEAEDTALTP